MKEHPLLLSTEMVLAYLADRKHVTRRIPGPTNSFVDGYRVSGNGWKALELDFTRYEVCEPLDGNTGFAIWSNKRATYVYLEPIYNPGDWLWFRETWSLLTYGDHSFYGYAADSGHHEDRKWRPSIHLPKEAARLWAEVTTVLCERVQDITEEQAVKEGVDWRYNPDDNQPNFKNYEPGCGTFELETAAASFRSLWASIHGWDNWTANPPVYAINFNPLSKTGRPVEDAKNVSHE